MPDADPGLTQEEMDERDLQLAVAGAQRLRHDEILQNFLTKIREAATHWALYGDSSEIREANRIRARSIDEIRGWFDYFADLNTERVEDEARDRAMEQ